MKRYGWVICLKPEKLATYKELHAAVWPDVLAMIGSCNLQNYTIYQHQLDDGKHYLFSHVEYVGDDFEADMAKMAADPTTQKWWAECMPCQEPLASAKPGEWWSTMEEVFHCG
jgi:L-rhamnose mutarotase